MLLFITSCLTNKLRTIPGSYKTKGGYPLFSSTIDLMQDSTFVYNKYACLLNIKSTGIWSIKENKLVLNSDLQPYPDSLPNFKVIKAENNNSDKITFDLLSPDTLKALPTAVGFMFYKGDTIDRQLGGLNGKMYFEKKAVDSIKIISVDIKEIVLADIDSDYYRIVAIKDHNMYEFFTNEICEIRNSSLINKKNNKKVRYYKVR